MITDTNTAIADSIYVFHASYGLGWADSLEGKTTMVRFEDTCVAGTWKGWKLVKTEELEVAS